MEYSTPMAPVEHPNIMMLKMSKSLDGFYQESGRAGRDGNDADCVLYFRGQDMSRLSGMVFGDVEGLDKCTSLEFHRSDELLIKIGRSTWNAQIRPKPNRMSKDPICSVRSPSSSVTQPSLIHSDYIFFRYFSTSSSLSLSAWSDSDGQSLTRCGHCDNCTRPSESLSRKDVTLESWKILQVVDRVGSDGGRVTVGMLADLVRGAGGGGYIVGGGGKGARGAKEKVALDLDGVCGGKITLTKNVCAT